MASCTNIASDTRARTTGLIGPVRAGLFKTMQQEVSSRTCLFTKHIGKATKGLR